MRDQAEPPKPLTTSERRGLFIKMAGAPGGAATNDVYKRAVELGDNVTEEAYHNLARRLVHRGLLSKASTPQGTRFVAESNADEQWLEEEELAAFVDPEYPLVALTVWKEAARQVNDVPEQLWIELRERLRGERARDLFKRALVSYADELLAQVGYIVELEKAPSAELPRLRKEAEHTRLLLLQMAKFGLGLSADALQVPVTLDVALRSARDGTLKCLVDEALLEHELARRIEDVAFVVDANHSDPKRPLLVAAVDGSTRGGVLSFLGEGGDLSVGYSPMVAINTAVGRLNHTIVHGQRHVPVFCRLPEKPEDMQRQDNRYTVMAKLFYPDLSDAEYMHSVWNAMDLVESKTALRVMGRWYGPGGAEIQPCDVVMRDGPVAPQDRDFNHYNLPTSYGLIVRDMIQTCWDIARKSRDDAQTVAGVVKNAQLNVFAPVINWFAAQVARDRKGQLLAWPLQSLNAVSDQLMLTRLLTAGRGKMDPWTRSCIVIRPFHATTNYAMRYRLSQLPADIILERYNFEAKALADGNEVDDGSWSAFRPESDPFLAMLKNVSYASFFLGAVPRLDLGKNLPRMELLVTASTDEQAPPSELWGVAAKHAERFFQALRQDGFDVSEEHGMFRSDAAIDVLPALIIRAHDTVKLWAGELLSRVQEYIGYYLSRYVRQKRIHGVKVRPFSRDELAILYDQLRRERELKGGGNPNAALPDK